jgi:hypothetical protein
MALAFALHPLISLCFHVGAFYSYMYKRNKYNYNTRTKKSYEFTDKTSVFSVHRSPSASSNKDEFLLEATLALATMTDKNVAVRLIIINRFNLNKVVPAAGDGAKEVFKFLNTILQPKILFFLNKHYIFSFI